MHSNDALQPFFGHIASPVERSQLEKQIQFQGNPCVDQSSSDEEDDPKIWSHLHDESILQKQFLNNERTWKLGNVP